MKNSVESAIITGNRKKNPENGPERERTLC